MSAGHSLRRQNYSFVTITPPDMHTTPATHAVRIIIVVVSALALDIATVTAIAMLGAGR